MFKQRSHDTHHKTHCPQIASNPNQYTVALLGDSLFERFKTTGSERSINHNPSILNLGVGGDKVLNVQYRFDQGLLDHLKNHQPNLKLMYIHMGSNNLKRDGFRTDDAITYSLTIQNIRRALPEVDLVITALFKQRDMADELIDEANQMLRGIADRNELAFLPFGDDQEGIMSEDKVHLNEAGYTKWNDLLEKDMATR
jgi:platelet-activating factor acetylhydrolase IB subunit beta/gamma